MPDDTITNAYDPARCAALNDLCREGRLPSGRMVFTRNAVIACMSETEESDPDPLAVILAKQTLAGLVAGFVFDGTDDPHGERDFGAFDHAGTRFFFKIVYYDSALVYASDDPTNVEITQRICTVMLASDY